MQKLKPTENILLWSSYLLKVNKVDYFEHGIVGFASRQIIPNFVGVGLKQKESV